MRTIKRALCRFGRWWYPAKEPEPILCVTQDCLNDGTEFITISWKGTGHDDMGVEFSMSGNSALPFCIEHYTQRMAAAHPEWRL